MSQDRRGKRDAGHRVRPTARRAFRSHTLSDGFGRSAIHKPERAAREFVALERVAQGPTTFADLAEHLGHRTTGVAKLLLPQLAEEGLVERTSAGGGTSRAVFRITDAGRAVLDAREAS